MFFFSKIRLLWYSIKYLVVFFNPTSYILNLNLHHILQLQHCLENLNSKVTNLSISLHARKQSTLIQGSPINSGAQGANWTQESSRPSLPPLKGSMHPQILIIFFSFSKQGLTRRPPHTHPPNFENYQAFFSQRIPQKSAIIFLDQKWLYGILSKTCCVKHCQIHAIFFLDKKCASSPPLPYPIALGAQHHLNPNTLGRPDLLWYIITFLIIFCREAWTTQIIFSFTFSKKIGGLVIF